ncbi:MAG TPA: hypothetical protein VHP83_24780 [Aggregatilineaceae bacterium]|nr:hypothetical protein [Aggregatilineaceae bacterium]
MRCLGQLLALGFVFVFVMLLPCSLWTVDTQRIALNGDMYKKLFADDGFYEQLIPAVLPSLLDEFNLEENSALTLANAINALDYNQWEKISPNLVPKEWVGNAVESNLDAFFSWLDGDRRELDIRFETGILKDRLLGEPGDRAIQDIVAHFPLCNTNAEKQQFVAFAKGKSGVIFPYCLPDPPDQKLVGVKVCTAFDAEEPTKCLDYATDPTYQEWLTIQLNLAKNQAANELPNELNVIQEMDEAAEAHLAPGEHPFSQSELSSMRSSVRLWQKTIYLAYLVPAAFMSLVVIVTVRSSKSFFRWMGWPLIIGSLFALIPLLFLPLLMSDLRLESQGELEQGFAGGGTLVAEITVNGMMRLLVGEFTSPVLKHCAILIAVGFFAVVISVLLPDPDAPPEPQLISYIASDTPQPKPTGTLE